jgi:hypothetical protein
MYQIDFVYPTSGCTQWTISLQFRFVHDSDFDLPGNSVEEEMAITACGVHEDLALSTMSRAYQHKPLS